MKISGFSLLRINGINVIIDLTWLVLFLLIPYTAIKFAQMYPDLTLISDWIIGGVVSVLVFCCALIHGLTQALAAAKFGTKVKHIRLHIFGCLVVPESRSARQEFVITLVGWATSIVSGFFFLAIYVYLSIQQYIHPIRGIAGFLAYANFILAAIHMIPGFPLDGGRIVRAILWDRWNDAARATRIVSQISNSLGLFFIIFGILQLFVTLNPDAVLLLIVGVFIKLSAVFQFKSVVEQRVLAATQVRQVMNSQVVTADWLISVEELVREYMYKYRHTHIPVCNREDFIGMVSIDLIKSVPKDLWTFKQVRDIMISIDEVTCVQPDTDTTEILKRMKTEKIAFMPVVENGRLIGVVTRSDIVKFFRIKSELGIT